MEYNIRPQPLFSACGLNCGLCPRYQTQGASKCPGCAGEGFLQKHPPCGVLSCSRKRGLDYCFQCEEFPCGKYDGADESDSFISHKNQMTDMEKARAIGIEAYMDEQNRKISLLEALLAGYDDGRHKSFFCMAVNLLALPDIESAMDKLRSGAEKAGTPKERAKAAEAVLRDIAGKRGLELKLRKKEKK